MSKIRLTKDLIRPAVYGGAFYGGGGGGAIEDGLLFATAAFSYAAPELLAIEALAPADILVTCSMVGAPAAREKKLLPEDFIGSVRLLQNNMDEKIAGFISNENGAVGTINGWLQAAYCGLPVVDAPANGRAHPTGIIGAMGLNLLAGYLSRQAAVGGNAALGRHMEMYVNGSVNNASAQVRHFAQMAGGMAAVCRNPVSAAYVREHGAPGAIKQAIGLGQLIETQIGADSETAAQTIAAAAGGWVIDVGVITEKQLTTSGGFDLGRIIIKSPGTNYVLSVWNEYLSLTAVGITAKQQVAAFPDLLVLLDCNSNLPLSSAQAEEGRRVIIIHVPSDRLKLGRGMKIAENLTTINEIIHSEGGTERSD